MPDRLPFARPASSHGSKGADPVEQFRGGRRLFEPLFPQEIKFRQACFEELSGISGKCSRTMVEISSGPGKGM